MDYGGENFTEGALMPQKRRGAEVAMSILVNLLLVILAGLIVMYFLLSPIPVSGTSMLNTIESGENVLVLKSFYSVERGDIVIVDLEKADRRSDDGVDLIIKRAVALEGDRFAFIYRPEPQSAKLDLWLKRAGETEFQKPDEPYTLDADMLYSSRIFVAFQVLPPGTTPDDQNSTLVGAGQLLALGDNRNISLDSRFHGLFDLKDLHGKFLMILDDNAFLNAFFNFMYTIKPQGGA
ncbi:MAG: signal peptidase I [Clostridiales bacterium]|nr:signal peptidase I [Clostridiales bacterium]